MKSDNYEFGGSLAGPIIKDKLFFFTASSPALGTPESEYQLHWTAMAI